MTEEGAQPEVDRLLEAAQAAIDDDSWGTARELARRILELDPTNVDALQLLTAAELQSAPEGTPASATLSVPTRRSLPGVDETVLLAAVSDLARLLHGLGSAVVATADLLQLPVLADFEATAGDARWFSSQAEEFITGLKELQAVKADLIKRIDDAKATGKKVTVEIKDVLPGFLKSQIEAIFGKDFLTRLLKLKPLVIDPATCEAESTGNTEDTFELDLADLYAYIGAVAAAILRKFLGEKLKITVKATVRMKLDCETLRDCSLEITKITGIEFEGAPNLSDITVDTKKGKASIGLNWIPKSITLLDLQDLLDKLAELIKKLKDDLEKITDETKRKEKQKVIDELEKHLSDVKKEQEKLKQFHK